MLETLVRQPRASNHLTNSVVELAEHGVVTPRSIPKATKYSEEQSSLLPLSDGPLTPSYLEREMKRQNEFLLTVYFHLLKDWKYKKHMFDQEVTNDIAAEAAEPTRKYVGTRHDKYVSSKGPQQITDISMITPAISADGSKVSNVLLN